MSFYIHKDSKVRDSRGEKIWFPRDGRAYYDKALQKTFQNIQQKAEYMKEKGLHMDGSSDSREQRRAPEAGDNRKTKVR